MKKNTLIALAVAMLIAMGMLIGSAHAATGLAVLTKDPSVLGRPVKDTNPVVLYGVPTDTDLVHISCTDTADWSSDCFTWQLWKAVKPGQKIEVCGNDLPVDTKPLPNGAPCTVWPWVAKPGYVGTAAASSTYQLCKGTSCRAGTQPDLEACRVAAGADSERLKAPGVYGCKTSVTVTTKLVTAPPIVVVPPVEPPKPPTSTNRCSNAALPASGKKWCPGHYVSADAMSWTAQRDNRRSAYDTIRNEPVVLGAMINLAWGQIEPSQGVYDFSEIDGDVAYLKAMGKRVMFSVWGAKYGGGLPSVPQWTGNIYIPDYVVARGGIAAIPSGGYKAKLSDPWVMGRYIALMQALAARYDTEPALEQVVTAETAIDPDADYVRLLREVGPVWKRTVAVIHPNWVSRAQMAKDIVVAADQNAMGIGAPDILPRNLQWEDHGSRALRGAGIDEFYTDQVGDKQDFGSTDYRGRVPVAYEYQALDGLAKLNPAAIYPYARDTLKATHLIWRIIGYRDASLNWSTGVLPVIKVNPIPVTAYPTDLPP